MRKFYTPTGDKEKKNKESHEVQTRTCERKPTHDDDFSSGVGAQDDAPGVSCFVFLETKHAYTQAKTKIIIIENVSRERNNEARKGRGGGRKGTHRCPYRTT
jgi:hypothetical protein